MSLFTYLRAVSVIKHSENDLRQRVCSRWVMRWWNHSWQVMLKGFAQNRIKCQIWPYDMFFYPHFTSQTFYLLPQAIQILSDNIIIKLCWYDYSREGVRGLQIWTSIANITSSWGCGLSDRKTRRAVWWVLLRRLMYPSNEPNIRSSSDSFFSYNSLPTHGRADKTE